MPNKTFLFLIISVLLCSPLPAQAAQNTFLQQPNIDYSADEVMTVGAALTVRSKVFYSPGKTRKDQSVQGGQTITIIRQDKNVMWILMPVEKIYMEMPIAGGASLREDISGDFLKETVVENDLGEEILNGVKATKRRVTIKGPDGGYGGLLWQSKNGIVVKMEMNSLRKDGETFTLELKNLRQEPQDPTLFEIPRGYTKMGMPSLGTAMK